MFLLRPLLLLLSLGAATASDTPPNPLPSTFGFINKSYTGERFSGKTLVVIGGTSGIGFATAAMFVQECADRVLIVGRNPDQGSLAAEVINEGASQAHCQKSANGGAASFLQANTLQRTELRAAFASLGKIHAVVNTAGIPGWTNVGLPDIPDEVFMYKTHR